MTNRLVAFNVSIGIGPSSIMSSGTGLLSKKRHLSSTTGTTGSTTPGHIPTSSATQTEQVIFSLQLNFNSNTRDVFKSFFALLEISTLDSMNNWHCLTEFV